MRGNDRQYMKKPFDKYWHYRHSVQSPDLDVRFMRKCYRQLKNKEPCWFREDFCFTFALSCEWVKLGKTHHSIAVDIKSAPLTYGKKHYLSLLKPEQKKRIHIRQANVLHYKSLVKVDIIGASNFSYFALKTRKDLKKYFQKCLTSLKPHGILILDCLGGGDCFSANEERTDHKNFSYYWEQSGFDPISHHAIFYIHYKRKGEKKRHKVFTYDWRLWTMPELTDLLKEAGFKTSHVYWEGSDKNGEGNGRFTRRKKGEECDSWIAYIIAEK